MIVGMVAAAAIGAGARAAEQSKSTLAFERLAASLAGQWKGVQDGTEFQVTYMLTANGSVLMEEFRPKNGPMMVTASQAKSVGFSLVRVTGLSAPGAWHNTGLVVTMEALDHLTQDWTCLSDGKTGKNSFHLTRGR